MNGQYCADKKGPQNTLEKFKSKADELNLKFVGSSLLTFRVMFKMAA